MRHIIFTLVILVCHVFYSGLSYGKDATLAPITVPVRISANQTNLREAALAEAQAKAFYDAIIKLSRDLYGPPPSFKSDAIERTILSSSIAKERNIGGWYDAEFTITFQHERLIAVARKMGLAGEAGTTLPRLLLPLYQENARQWMREDTNPWFEAWKEYLSKTVVGNAENVILLPLGDLEDISKVTLAAIASYDREQLGFLFDKYGVHEIVIAEMVVVEDENGAEVNVLTHVLPEQGNITHAPLVVTRVSGGRQPTWFEKPMFQVHGFIAALSDNTEQRSLSQHVSLLKVRIPFTSLKEWSEIKNLIQENASSMTMNDLQLSSREAWAVLHFSEDVDNPYEHPLKGLELVEEAGRGYGILRIIR